MTSQNEQNIRTHKHYSFPLRTQPHTVTFNSHFDSGNAHAVKQLSDFAYRLECEPDCLHSSTPVNSKSWFYFSVCGFPAKSKVRFTVCKVQALISLYYSKYARYYRPVFRIEGQGWQRLETEAELYLNEEGVLECLIQYTFSQELGVEFAFCYPYQFQKNIDYLDSLAHFESDPIIYYHREVLIQSTEGRPIHLLTITSQTNLQATPEREEAFDKFLFTDHNRPLKIRKPVVLITARVHPGETPASYAMEGVIDFLLRKDDLRAHLLRSMFVFMIVPMINVDGVFHGHFRMDTHGRNLNRFYIRPDPHLQPAIYGIKSLARHLIGESRLSFYFDLHAHNAKKGCFIYGNAFSEFVEQVESQVFCKLFAMNHPGFEYEYCNFSQKHMNAKDRFEDLTKEGCGRVVMHKEANIIHSYSLECGIISANNNPPPLEPSNTEFKVSSKGFVPEDIETNSRAPKMPDGSALFEEDSYRNLGKNLLVSILDVFDKNPFSRVYGSRYKSMENLRRVTAFEIFHSAERFRMFERSLFGKVKNINLLIQDILNTKPQYKPLYNCQFVDDQELAWVEWPRNIQGLLFKNNKIDKPKKAKSILSEPKPFIIGTATEDSEKKTPRLAQDQSPPQKELSPEDSKKSQAQNFPPEQDDPIDAHNNVLKMERSETIQLQVSPEKLGYESAKIIGSPLRRTFLQLAKRSSDVTVVQDKEDDLCSQSDESEVKDNEINQEILLMCEDEKEENQVLAKILLDKFDDKDYDEIEEKFKSKNTLDGQAKEFSSALVFSSPPLDVQTQSHTSGKPTTRGFASNKDQKYRVNRKVVINTCELGSKHKRKAEMAEEMSFRHYLDEQSGSALTEKRPTAAEQFRKNIYDAIKQEIKEGLRREYDKRRQKERMNIKMVDSFRMKNTRARSNHNQLQNQKMKSKVKLPSLGSNMYIITTSTRALHKN